MFRVFVSYTLRDKELSIADLKKLDEKMKLICGYHFYIDILHNVNKNNPQQAVMEQLHSSDFLLLLQTSGIYDSPWVCYELRTAEQLMIPIYLLSSHEINHFEPERFFYPESHKC